MNNARYICKPFGDFSFANIVFNLDENNKND